MGRSASLRGGKPPARAGTRTFRFPCGHVDNGDSVDRRTRVTQRAVWINCRACNVIGLVVARRSHQRTPSATR